MKFEFPLPFLFKYSSIR